jgi:hypothetical protein
MSVDVAFFASVLSIPAAARFPLIDGFDSNWSRYKIDLGDNGIRADNANDPAQPRARSIFLHRPD